ncbi:hypothetical protein [Paraburkholderia sp. SIMBA_054]|uniref:hypothetical protein n=1 Tax=Paraburkholderia sp. SIMBA_054 TaxID=3085795 RepID=UPI003979764F
MRALLPDLLRLYRAFSLTSREEADAARVERTRERDQVPYVPEAPIREEIHRAHVLMSRIESTGVKFPVQIYDALDQARAASEQNRWTLQVDRSFYSALSLLESIARLPVRVTATQQAATDQHARGTANAGWTVIISNSQKMLEGNW